MVLVEYYVGFRLLFKTIRASAGFYLFVFLVFFLKNLSSILLLHGHTIKPSKNFFCQHSAQLKITFCGPPANMWA